MNRPGTDLLAIACIVGGGVVAGGVTLALARGLEAPSLECATTAGVDGEGVVALGDEGVAIVRPDRRVRAVRDCMAAQAVEHAEPIRIELAATAELRDLAREQAASARDEARQEVERAREEVERARREAEDVRQRVDRIRERVRRTRMDRAERAQERQVERLERAHERRAEHLERAHERMRRAEIRIRRPEGGQGLRLEALDADRGSFEFRLEGLEALESLEGLEGLEGLGDAIRLELGTLEGMEFQFELEGMDDAELERRIEQRIDEQMRRLEERLDRLTERPGGGF